MAIRGVRTASIAVLGLLVGLVGGLALSVVSPLADGSDRSLPRRTVSAAPVSLTRMSPCERLALSRRKRLAFTSGSGPRILVIGDSWSTGAKLPPGTRAWPSYLDGRVTVDGVPGSGFSTQALGCVGLGYGDRVASSLRQVDPGLVVVQGGLNDTDVSDAAIRHGFYQLALALGDRKVVVFGPARAPKRADAVGRVDDLLARLSHAAGYDYVSTTDLRLHYLGDGLHLTRHGHHLLGTFAREQVDLDR